MPQHQPDPQPLRSLPTAAPDPAPAPVPVGVLLPPPAATPVTGGPLIYGEDRAWTTRTIGVLVATYTRPGDAVGTNDPDLYPTVADVATWLNRSITLLPGHPWPFHQPGLQQPADLILAWLPEPGHDSLTALTTWMRVHRRRLSATGYLIASVDPFGPARPDQAHSPRYTDHATNVITAARAAGLAYHQHLIAIHTRLAEPPPPDADAGAGRPVRATGTGGAHARVHTDLYVFAAHPPGPPGPRRADDHPAEDTDGIEVGHG